MGPTSTAIHEAGHAVAALAFDSALGGVSINPNADKNQAGHAANEPCEDPRNEAIVFYAGHAAERLLNVEAAERDTWASGSDYEAAGRLVGEDDREKCQLEAEQLVRTNWCAVYFMALELDRQKTLDDCEASSIYEVCSHGSEAVADLAQYRTRCPSHSLSLDDYAAEVERLEEVLIMATEAAGSLLVQEPHAGHGGPSGLAHHPDDPGRTERP